MNDKEELIEKFKPYMDGWRQRQSISFAEKCAEIAIDYATSQTEALKKEIEELKAQIEKHNSQYCKCDVPDRDGGYTYCHACKKNVSDERMDEILKDN